MTIDWHSQAEYLENKAKWKQEKLKDLIDDCLKEFSLYGSNADMVFIQSKLKSMKSFNES